MSTFNIEKFLNSLPDDIQSLDISNMNLNYIPSLKRFSRLEVLYCKNNFKLNALPELNSTLKELHCANCSLTELPLLNDSLIFLSCCYNLLTELPELNRSLICLQCNGNKLTKIPELNSSLRKLYCCHNRLTELPLLNDCLEVLYAEDNLLTRLPKLNNSLHCLNIFHNPILELPELNCCLEVLFCKSDQLPFEINCATCDDGFLNSIKINEINRKIKCLKQFKEQYWALKFKTPLRDWLWLKVRLPRILQHYHPDSFLSSVTEEDLNA